MQAHTPDPKDTLTQLLTDLRDNAEEDNIAIRDIVRSFRSRGFGALLVIPSLITILPTGAIPMVPAVCGLIIAFSSVQIIFGRRSPWLPKKLNDITIPKERLVNGINLVLPATQVIDRYVYRRFSLLINPVSEKLTACICLIFSLIMISIGFIPMLPATVALPIFIFGLGLIVRDGLIISLGFLTIIGSAFGLGFLVRAI